METPFLFLSLFLFSALLLCEAAEKPTAVLDIDGKIVRRGVKYYVVPVQKNRGGGLDLASTGKDKCPKSVVQVGPKGVGNTVMFYPANSNSVVRNGTDLNIEFSGGSNTGCSDTNVWQITHDPESVDVTHYVVSGGEKGNPSDTTTSNWFMILKTTNGYKFKFCPAAVCDCNPVCMDIGISVEKGERLLEVDDIHLPTFEVNFRKA